MATSPVTALRREEAHEVESAGRLRVNEKVALGFLAYATILALELRLSLLERTLILGLNGLVAVVLFLFGRKLEERPSGFLGVLRDWFPAALILLAYRESGMFFSPDPTHRLDQLFVQWDAVLLRNYWVQASFTRLAPWLQYYLEMAYLLCYPLVPLGLGCLLLARRQLESGSSQSGGAQSGAQNLLSRVFVDHFWTSVLLAALFCYAVYPFFPLTPPRLLFQDLPGPRVAPLLRTVNFWVLGTYGVQACIFPSGHVAAVTATALVVRAYRPRLGALFILAAASVAAATVFLRYHYAADAVAGAVVGWAAFGISQRVFHRPGASARF